MHAYGISLGDSVAMITAANETMQDAPKVGNALKTIAMRMTGVTYKMKDGKVVLSDVGKALRDIAGIDVFTDSSQTEVKNMTTLLDELNGKYSKLSDAEQKALSEKLSGKQNAATLQALLTNFDKYKQIRAEFASGQHLGSADKELKNYTDSLAAKISEIKNIWLSIGSTLVKSDMTKGALDAFISLSDGIDKVVKSLDSADALLPAIIASFTSIRSIFKDFSSINSSKNNMTSNMVVPGNNVGMISKIKSKFDDIKLASMSASDGVNAFNSSMVTNGRVLPAAKNGLTQFTNSLKQTNIGAKAVALTSGLLQGALISLGIAGIAFIAKKISDVIHQYDIAAEKNRENIENIKSQVKSLDEQKKGLSSLSKEYDELSQKQNKSKEEQQRYNDLRKEISDIAPELVAGTDADGNVILALNGSLDDTIKKLEEAIKQKNELLKEQQNNLGVNETKNIRDTVEKLRSEKTKLETDINNAELKLTNSLDDKLFSNNTFEAKLQRYKEGLTKREEVVAKSNEKILKNLEEYNTKELAIQQRAFNKIFEGKNYNNIKDDNVKDQINSFVDSLDWGKLNLSEQNSVISGFEKLSPIIEKNTDKVKEWSKVIQDANTNFQASGNVEAYKQELQGLAEELEGLTGIDSSTWIKTLTQEFGGLDIAKQQLQNFLQSYSTSMADLENGDSFAIKLKQQFQDLQNFITDFTIDGKVNINLLKDIRDGKSFTDLPQQIKEAITGVLGKDNKVTEVEQSVLLKVATTVQDEGKISDDVSEKLNKLFSGKLTEEELKVPIKLDNGMEIGTEELEKLNSLYKENPVKVNFVAEVSNEEALKNISKELDEIPIDKQVRVDIETGLAQGNIDTVSKAIESLPPEKQLQVIATIESAMNGINSIDKKKLKDKLVTLKGNATDANNKINTVDNKKIKDKTTAIKAKDNASATIKAIDDKIIKNKTFTITTIFKTIGNAINNFVEKSNPYGKSSSQSIQSIIPTTQASTFSTLSQPQASPMIQAQANETGISSPTPISSVFATAASMTSKIATTSTPIAIGGQDIHASMEYSIDLLKELDNRLKMVSNTLSSVDKLAEKATGKSKINWLTVQNELYDEQIDIIKEKMDALKLESNYYKYYLERRGMLFNKDGNATNYEELLLKKEKELEVLEKKANKDKASDSDKNKYENAKHELDQLKKYSEEYFNATFDEIPKLSEEWNDLKGSIRENEYAIKDLRKEAELFTKNSKLKEIEIFTDEYSDNKDLLNSKLENASLEEKAKIYKELLYYSNLELELDKKKIETLESMLPVLQKELSSFGFNFDKNQSISNIDEVLNTLQNSGNLERVNKLLEEYVDIQRDELPTAKKNWQEINNEIRDQNKELKALQKELDNLSKDSKTKDHERDLAQVNNALDANEILLEKAQGIQKVNLLKERIKLLEQLKKETQDLINYEKSHRQTLMTDLSKYGFNFRDDGSIAGYGGIIDKLKKTLSDDEFEEVFAKIEEYLDLTNDKIPDLENNYLDLRNTIKDVYEDQLDTVAEIEDKLTEVYKKQLEERKKLIEEELDKRLEALDKQKKAYNDARKEAEYKDEYENQKKTIEDLQKQINLASRDNTISGQKKLQDLLKQLTEEEKKLQNLVQDKIDSDVNDMFDKESDRLEQESEDTIKKLEEQFSDSKIAEMVADAIGSGMFTDIEGNVTSLQDTLINFAKESGDLFGVLGSIIKSELITKLKITEDTMREIGTILKELDLNTLSSQALISSYSNVKSVDYRNHTSGNNTVQFNSPLMVVEGGIDRDVLPEVRDMVNKVKYEIIDGFYKNLK